MKSPSFTKKTKKTGIFSFFQKYEEQYRADKMGESAEPCPTPTLALKDREKKLFQ